MVADPAGDLAGRVGAQVVAPPDAQVRADQRTALEAYVGLEPGQRVVRTGGDLESELGLADVTALVLVRGLGEVTDLRLDRLGDQHGPVRHRAFHDQVPHRVLAAALRQLGTADRSGEPPEQPEQPSRADVRNQRAVRRTAGACPGEGQCDVLRRSSQVKGGGVVHPGFHPVRERQGLRCPAGSRERHGEVVRQPPAQPVPHAELRGVHAGALPTRPAAGPVAAVSVLVALGASVTRRTVTR